MTSRPVSPAGRPPAVLALAVMPDGEQVVGALANGLVQILDLSEGRTEELGRLNGRALSVAVSPDGTQVVAGGEDGLVLVWERANVFSAWSGLGARVVGGHAGPVWDVALTPGEGYVVSAGDGGGVRITELATEQRTVSLLNAGTGRVWSVAITPDGSELFTAGADGTVRAWDLLSQQTSSRSFTGHRGGVLSVAVTADGGRVISGGDDATVRLWDRVSGRPQGGIPVRDRILELTGTPDGGRAVCACADGALRVVELATGAVVGELFGHAGKVLTVTITPDGLRVVSGGADGTVRSWDLATGEQLAVITTDAEVPGFPADAAPPATAGPPGAPAERVAQRRVARNLLSEVLSDAESAEDRLGVVQDVRTLAALLAAHTTVPPLSVALLGDWGTGKSSFMRQLVDRVDRLAGLARQDPRQSAFVSHVRQVRFNAWHYSDDHLWVGLVEHLFRELAESHPAEPPARDRVALEDELAKKSATREFLDDQIRAIDEIDPGRGLLGRPLGPLYALRVFRAAGGGAWRQLRSGRQLWFALALIALGVGAFWAADRFVQAIVGWLSGVALVVAGILKPALGAWHRIRDYGERAGTQLRNDRDRLDLEIAEIERNLERKDPARSLKRLIVDISDSERYASYRGLTGRIHYDLRRLSEHLADANQEWAAGRSNDPPPLQRIILYVDDLDRCEAPRVIEVLQAVNLLLTMPLFVVVVGVDPRWLLRALAQHHAAIFTPAAGSVGSGHRPAQPLDYLDKIFHIPFALRPIGSRAGDFLRQLLPPLDEDAPATTTGAPQIPGSVAEAATAEPAAAPAGTGQPRLDEPVPTGQVVQGNGGRLQMPAGDRLHESGSGGGEPSAATQEPVAIPELVPTPTLEPQLGSVAPAPGPAQGRKGGGNGAPIAAPADALPGQRAGEGRESVGLDSATRAAFAEQLIVDEVDESPVTDDSRLRLRQPERDFLPLLVPLLPTPRAIKKLTNLYRLLRIGVSGSRLEEFVGGEHGGPYQAAALLLAVVVGMPSEARDLLRSLLTVTDDEDIVQTLRVIGQAQPASTSQVGGPQATAGQQACLRLAEVITSIRQSTPVHGDVLTYRLWGSVVSRYSFEAYDLFTAD